ncbi:MAG TPA: hypothetical protein VE093_30535 [Polyangiaceae bacterium]|jgi:hypothetical protein|nr:hypothetical protein [Polyangiaceae bacterium]
MDLKIVRKTGAVGLLCLLSAPFAGCEQPELLCNVASGAYAVQYFPKDAGDDCLMLPGELIGMAVYNPPNADKTGFDSTRTMISVQALSMGALADEAQATAGAVDADRDHTPFSMGDYSNRPGEDSFCSAPRLTAAEQHIPETAYTDADGDQHVFPETRLTYEWSDLSVHMTFATPGNAATGTVTITKSVRDPTTGTTSSCASTYIASALFPTVSCGATDAMGKPTGAPDDTRCCATADLANDRSLGSGIHPDFKLKCDPTLLLCVLDWRPGEAFPPLGGNAFCGRSE